MPHKHDFPPIQYTKQIQYSSSSKSSKNTKISHHIDDLVDSTFLKQYFALDFPLDFAKRNQVKSK